MPWPDSRREARQDVGVQPRIGIGVMVVRHWGTRDNSGVVFVSASVSLSGDLGNPNRGRGYCKEHLHCPDTELGVGVAISIRAGECGTHWRNSVSEGI